MTNSFDRNTHRHDAGFVCSIDPRDARRQLTMSLTVVAALVVAIVTALVTLGIHPVSASSHPVISAQRLVIHPAEASNRDVEWGGRFPSRS